MDLSSQVPPFCDHTGLPCCDGGSQKHHHALPPLSPCSIAANTFPATDINAATPPPPPYPCYLLLPLIHCPLQSCVAAGLVGTLMVLPLFLTPLNFFPPPTTVVDNPTFGMHQPSNPFLPSSLWIASGSLGTLILAPLSAAVYEAFVTHVPLSVQAGSKSPSIGSMIL